MASKLEAFLKDNQIDVRRLLVASAKLEKLRPEDRKLRLTRREGRKSEDPAKKKAATETPKPRSGRPLTDRSLTAALAGKEISGPQKTRLLRALNHVLEGKKKGAVDLRAVFDLPQSGKGKKEAAS